MNPYEMTFIVRPDLDEEQTRVAIESVTGRITSQGGEVIATYPWNPPRRRLAYPIKDFGDGYYMTTVFRFSPEGLKEFERGLRLNTAVLRFLILQATDLNITQGQQRAQQAAARAAAPPAPAGAPPPAPQVGAPQAGAPQPAAPTAPPPETSPDAPQAGAPEPAAPTAPSPVTESTAPEQAAPVIEEIAPSPAREQATPVVEEISSSPEPTPEPEPVATAPAAEGQE